MTPEVLNAFLALYAASSGVSLAYLALPDYRYRNSITEYFEYHINRTVRLNGQFKAKNFHTDSIRNMIARERKRQSGVKRLSAANDDSKVSPWLRFLEELLEMPKGHIPNSEISVLDADRKLHRTDKTNWFLTVSGCFFRRIYMVHRDNTLVTLLAIISLTLLTVIIGLIVFAVDTPSMTKIDVLTGIYAALFLCFFIPALFRMHKRQFRSNGFYVYAPISVALLIMTYLAFDGVAGGNVSTVLVSVLFLIGSVGLIVPALLAYIGRRFVCASARTAIHDAVENLLSAELNDEASEWANKAHAAT
jgi:hypothetical protein